MLDILKDNSKLFHYPFLFVDSELISITYEAMLLYSIGIVTMQYFSFLHKHGKAVFCHAATLLVFT